MFAQIICFVMTVVLMKFAVSFARKNQHHWAGGCVVLSVAMFVVALIAGNHFNVVWYGLSLEQLLCWLFGAAFFGMAVFFAKKDNLAYSFIILLVSVFCCVCGFSSIQGLLKTHILWQVTDSLKTYGEKIDKYQDTVSDMHKSLADEQSLLATNQATLSNSVNEVQQRLNLEINKLVAVNLILIKEEGLFSDTNRLLANSLATAETNIDAQQKKLSDVEYWVEHLYGNMVQEPIKGSDLNHVEILTRTNGNNVFTFRLDSAPIANSVEAYYTGSMGIQYRLSVSGFYKNVTMTVIPGCDTNTEFFFKYVSDTRQTNLLNTFTDVHEHIKYNEGAGTFNYY